MNIVCCHFSRMSPVIYVRVTIKYGHRTFPEDCKSSNPPQLPQQIADTMRATHPLPRIPNLYLGTMTFSWGQTSSHVNGEISIHVLCFFDVVFMKSCLYTYILLISISIFISLVLVFICTCTLTNVLFSSDSIASDMLNTFVHFHDKGVPVRIDTARIVRIYSYSILIHGLSSH